MVGGSLKFLHGLVVLAVLASLAPAARSAVVLTDPAQNSFGDWVVSAELDSAVDVLGITLDLAITQLEPDAGSNNVLSSLLVTKQVDPVFAPDTGSGPTNVFLASIVEQASGTIVTWKFQGLPKTDPFTLGLDLTGTVNEGFIDQFGDIFEGDIVDVQATAQVNTMPIPEPATYALFGAGLVLVAWTRRRSIAARI